ncbi:hypothetical protein DL96DRAFT_1581072, partial [Flagelloscypha sp. PMI_526]
MNLTQRLYKDEWTSVWVNHYSQPEMSSPSRSAYSPAETLFSPPAGITLRDPGLPLSKSIPPPVPERSARRPSLLGEGASPGRSFAPQVKPLSIRKRYNVPSPLKLVQSVRYAASRSTRALPNPPRKANSQLSRSDSASRRRPVPMILSPEADSFSQSNIHGVLVLSPSLTAGFKSNSPSSEDSASIYTPSPTAESELLPCVAVAHVEDPFTPALPSTARSELYVPLSSRLGMKHGKPTQAIPSSALHYERRIHNSELDEDGTIEDLSDPGELGSEWF